MIKDSLKVGATHSSTVEVSRERTISFLGENLRIYATPYLINDLEQTCLDFLLAHVEVGENSVGTHVNVAHMGATLMGMSVKIEVKVVSIEGRAVKFQVAAYDGVEQVCSGDHTRFVVNVDKLRLRVADKAARVHAKQE